MDYYYSSESEYIESLNLLRPPVKRSPWNTNGDYPVYRNNTKTNFLRGLGHKSTIKRSASYKNTSHEDTSTSLILKKTSESQFLKLYPVVSHTSLHCQEQSPLQNTDHPPPFNSKPLIQVTVIPKSNQNLRAKLFKQRIDTKTLQATSSNHENSIQTKNVYLVVAGRNKEKIYEIKTTGSEKFEKESTKDDNVKNQRNLKHFIKNFNMERKRKKDKKNDVKIDKRKDIDNKSVRETKIQGKNIRHNCTCSPENHDDENDAIKEELHNNVHDVRSGRSKVRIFGRIGVTEDDKYFLKCQATVNDEPVPTSLSTAEKQLSSSSLADYRNNVTTCQRNVGMACVRGQNQDKRRNIKSLRDSIMQTDYRNDAVQELLTNIDNKNRISNESQSTQVNFNKITGNALVKTSLIQTSEHTRCICSNTDSDYPVINTVNGFDCKNLKSCQSPLVIISVFPKQDNNITDVSKTIQCAQMESKRNSTLPKKLSQENKTKMSIHENTIKKSARSRSPSPKGPKIKSKSSKTIEPRQAKTNSRTESPTRSKLAKKDSKKDTNSLKQTIQFYNSNTKKESEEKKLKQSEKTPRSPIRKSPPASPNKREPQNKNVSKQNLKPKSKSPIRKVDVGINTEHLKTKKELVDSYTNKINEQMSLYKEKPVETVSKISVNIDSENEYYDVTFRQNQFTTDLNVRKTIKEASAQKYFDECQNVGSMRNVNPYMSKTHRRKSISENPSDGLINITSRLMLRDSLEIGHRREEVNVTKVMQTRRIGGSEKLTVNSVDMEFLAPIKHFTGDNCTICDPVERDREIRELLGVEGRRAKSQFKDPQSPVSSIGDQMSRHCFYSNQRETTFVAGFALDPNGRIGERRSYNNPNSDQSDYKNKDQTNSSETNSNSSLNNHFHPNQKEVKRNSAAEDPCPCDGKEKTCDLPCCKKTNYGTQYENNIRAGLPMPVPIQKYSDSDSNKHFEKFNQDVGDTGFEEKDRQNMDEASSGPVDKDRNYDTSSSDQPNNIEQYKENNKTKHSSSQTNTNDDPINKLDQSDQKEVSRKTSFKQNNRQSMNQDSSDHIEETRNHYDPKKSVNLAKYNDSDETKSSSSQKNTDDDLNNHIDETDQKEASRKTNVKQKKRQSMNVDSSDHINETRNYNGSKKPDNLAKYKDDDEIKSSSSQKHTDEDPNNDIDETDQKEASRKTSVKQKNRQSMEVDSNDRLSETKNYNEPDQSDNKTQYKDNNRTKHSSSQKNTDGDLNNYFDQTNQKEASRKTSVKQKGHRSMNGSDRIVEAKKYNDPNQPDNLTQYKDNESIKRFSSQKNNDNDPEKSVFEKNQEEISRKTSVKRKVRQNIDLDFNDRIDEIRKYKDPNRSDKIIQYKFSKTKLFYRRKKTDDDLNVNFDQVDQKAVSRKTSVKQKDRQSMYVGSSDRIGETRNSNQTDNIAQIKDKENDKPKRLSTQKNNDDDPKTYFEPTNQKEVKRKWGAKKKDGHNTGLDLCPCAGSDINYHDNFKCVKVNIDTNKLVQESNEEEVKRKTDTDDAEETNQEEVIRKIDTDESVDREYQAKQSEGPNVDRTALYQQLTLNRNIQIFLQVEQFAKKKPIVLSKKQYKKIKKTIENTILDKDKSKNVCLCNVSIVSVKEKSGKHTQDVISKREALTDKAHKHVKAKESKKPSKSKKRSSNHKEKEQLDTVVLFSNDARGSITDEIPPKEIMQRAASSMEMRNTSMAYWQHVTFSSTNMGSIGSSSYAHRKNSIETIFRGHKKSLTPNLGTSAFSLFSEAHVSESQSLKLCSPDSKARKPFLKRLMSCLVVRSPTGSKKIAPIINQSVNSSVDSYHISTSLGAIEMTSSIYDTSASFYSDHSIHPLSNKLKKGFFSSVRGFLTSRKS